MELLFATTNPHKIDEVRQILRPLHIDVAGLDQLGFEVLEPDEDGLSFSDNACIKAVYYAQVTGRMCLADDSGLEVDALHGDPGVHSARYAGVDGSREERDRANNEKLLHHLKDVPMPQRTARFVCVMALSDPGGDILAETRGVFEGVIGYEARGSNGFGYDPLLWLPNQQRTSAELTPQEKNAMSHRGDAARKMSEAIAAMHLAN